jgi:hypothetical protein
MESQSNDSARTGMATADEPSAGDAIGQETNPPQALPDEDEALCSARALRFAAPALFIVPLALVLYVAGSRAPVPPRDAPGPNAAWLSGRIDPNTATWAELATLPRLGETMAKRIVAYRESRAAAPRPNPALSAARPVFCIVRDLDAIPGIGPKTLDEIGPYLSFPANACGD